MQSYHHSAIDRTPYTYLIGWKSLDIWYYGARWGKNCHPSDLWVKYFTSSKGRKGVKGVLEYRKEFGEPDLIEIRKTFCSIEDCQRWEQRVLQKLNVTKSDRFLNRSSPGTNFLVDNRGTKNGMFQKGHLMSQEHISKLSEAAKRPKSETQRKKISESRILLLAEKEKTHLRFVLRDAMKGKPNGMLNKKQSDYCAKRSREVNLGMVNAKFTETGKHIGKVSVNDSRFLTGEIIAESKGRIIAKLASTGISIGGVSRDDPRWATGEIVGIAKKLKIKEN